MRVFNTREFWGLGHAYYDHTNIYARKRRRLLSRFCFEMVSGDEFEEDDAEAGASGAAGVEEPEGGGGSFRKAADPVDKSVRGDERLPRHCFRAVVESECEFEVDGDHAGRIAAAAR